MRWELADEQDMLRDSFRAWLDHHAPTHAVRDWLDAGEVGPFEQAFARDGWLSVGFPESYGGQGGGLLELALIAEQLGATAAPASAWLASVLALPALVGVPDVASAVLFGDGHAALAVDADRPLDDPGSIEAQADGAGHRVTGSVSSVLGADRARHLLVPARTGSGRRLYLVDAGADGVAVRGRRLLDRSRSVAGVRHDRVVDGTVEPQHALQATVRSRVTNCGGRVSVDEPADHDHRRRVRDDTAAPR